MIELISENYRKENCICYERKIKAESPPFAVKIVPNNGYVLKRYFVIDDSEKEEIISGWAQIAINQIDTFSQYVSVLKNEGD